MSLQTFAAADGEREGPTSRVFSSSGNGRKKGIGLIAPGVRNQNARSVPAPIPSAAPHAAKVPGTLAVNVGIAPALTQCKHQSYWALAAAALLSQLRSNGRNLTDLPSVPGSEGEEEEDAFAFGSGGLVGIDGVAHACAIQRYGAIST